MFFRVSRRLAAPASASYAWLVARRHGREDEFGALLVAATVFGVAGALVAASGVRDANARRREAFRDRMRASIGVLGVEMVAATLGRGANNAPFWDVTIQWPMGEVAGTRILLPPSAEPYSDQALASVAERVAKLAA
jgi:hypothetical protein